MAPNPPTSASRPLAWTTIEELRPMALSQILGQPQAVGILERVVRNAATGGPVTHLALVGPHGIGKTSSGLALARALEKVVWKHAGFPPKNAERTEEGYYVVRSSNSTAILQNPFAFFLFEALDPRQEFASVEAEFQRAADEQRAPSHYAVVYVSNPPSMKPAMWRWLSSMMDSGGRGSIRVMIEAVTAEEIDPAVLGRCRRVDFHRLPAAAIRQIVTRAAKELGRAVEERAVSSIVRESRGDARVALNLLVTSDGRSAHTSVKPSLKPDGRPRTVEFDDAEVVRLRDAGKSWAEISASLGAPETTIRRAYDRAKTGSAPP